MEWTRVFGYLETLRANEIGGLSEKTVSMVAGQRGGRGGGGGGVEGKSEYVRRNTSSFSVSLTQSNSLFKLADTLDPHL